MNNKIKHAILDLLPPMFTRHVRHLRRHKHGVSFSGNYDTWVEAVKNSTGYDEPSILEKATTALLKVKSGEARFERDTVIFDAPEYSYPLLAALLHAALKVGRPLNVLDIGGSLGSTYYQVRSYVPSGVVSQWSIVEQPNFVEVGQDRFADEILRFYPSIDACLQHQKPDFVLLSSVLQYLESPLELIDKVIEHAFRYVVLDRTPVFSGLATRLTVQTVPPHIYEACYPCWILEREELVAPFEDRYMLLDEFQAHIGTTISLGDAIAHYKGFVFMQK